MNRGMKVSGGILLGIIAVAFIGPLLSPHDYLQTDFDALLQGPTSNDFHIFGTDDLGRDLFVRSMLGVQVTILVAIVASAVSLLIGVAYGATAGYLGGRIDAVMMRFVDTLYALPFIFFVILLMVAFERNFLLIFVAIGAINWLDMARIVRGQTLSLREREFVEAARALGVPAHQVMRRHVVPNLLGPLVIQATTGLGVVILAESTLSFLGLGPGKAVSWGALLDQGTSVLLRFPHVALFSGGAIAVTVLGFNLMGDWLRDRLDPRLR